MIIINKIQKAENFKINKQDNEEFKDKDTYDDIKSLRKNQIKSILDYAYFKKKKMKKIKEFMFNSFEFEDKLISFFDLKIEMKIQIKIYINGKDIMKDNELMDTINNNGIMEIKNINEDLGQRKMTDNKGNIQIIKENNA